MENLKSRFNGKKRFKGMSGQDIQDDIFRKMSADKKLKAAAGLWLLAKELAGEKIGRFKNFR